MSVLETWMTLWQPPKKAEQAPLLGRRKGTAPYAPWRNPGYRWYEECQKRHQRECQSQWWHHIRMKDELGIED